MKNSTTTADDWRNRPTLSMGGASAGCSASAGFWPTRLSVAAGSRASRIGRRILVPTVELRRMLATSFPPKRSDSDHRKQRPAGNTGRTTAPDRTRLTAIRGLRAITSYQIIAAGGSGGHGAAGPTAA